MTGLQSKVDIIVASFCLDAIDSSFFPGVSNPSVIGGLKDEECLEICKILGETPKVKMLDFSEYNPSIECKISGQNLVNLFFKYCKSLGSTLAN